MGPSRASRPKGEAGKAGTRPTPGMMPKRPEKAQGMRIEPAPSVPMWKEPMPSAAAAAAPPEEPPGVRARFQGLRVTPVSLLCVTPIQPNSGIVVWPTSTQPASLRLATGGASKLAAS